MVKLLLVLLSGWRSKELLERLRDPKMLHAFASKRRETGKQFVSLLVDVPFILLGVVVSVLGFWRAPLLWWGVKRAPTVDDRRWVIAAQAQEWAIDLPFVFAFGSSSLSPKPYEKNEQDAAFAHSTAQDSTDGLRPTSVWPDLHSTPLLMS